MHSKRPYPRKFAFLPSHVTTRVVIGDFALRQGFLLPMPSVTKMHVALSQLEPANIPIAGIKGRPRELTSSRMTRIAKRQLLAPGS